MRQDQRQHVGQRRPGLEQQPVEIDAARQPLDDVAEAVERMGRVGAVRRWRAAAPAASPRTPCAPPASAASGPGPSASRRCARSGASTCAKPSCREFAGEDVRVVRQASVRDRPPARRTGRRRTRHAAAAIRAASPPSASPSSRRRPSSASGSAGRRCVCWSSIICTRCSTVRSRAIGVGEASRDVRLQAPGPASARASASSVAGARSAGSRPPWISCWTWVKNSTSRMPPRPRLRSKPGPNAWPCA